MKSFLKNALTVALLTVFVLIALGSTGSTPSPSYGGGGGSSGGGGGMQICSDCRGSGSSCPFNSSHIIDLPDPEDPNAAWCSTCSISFPKQRCRSCGGTGRR